MGAPCTMRSQIASAMVGSPITSCQDDIASCDTISVEARDAEPAQTRLVAQRGGQEALPGAAFAGDDEVLGLTDPAAAG